MIMKSPSSNAASAIVRTILPIFGNLPMYLKILK